MSVVSLTRRYKPLASGRLRQIISTAQAQIADLSNAGMFNGPAEQAAIDSIQAATDVLTARGAALSLPFVPLSIQDNPRKAFILVAAVVVGFFMVRK